FPWLLVLWSGAFRRSRATSMGSCENRITLYPAAPLRLATLLHARTIAWKDGAHLHNGRLATPNLRWVSPATHPTHPTPHLRSVGTVSLLSCPPRRWHVERRALWHQAVLDITPQGNCQLARDGDDHDLPHSRAMACGALNEPLGECTFRLMSDPQPCGLNHNGAHMATACSRNPLAAFLLAAV